jgi:hypothetical protein
MTSTNKRTESLCASLARTTVSAERTDVFRFLDLPGEIRNTIYEYCEPSASQKLVHSHDITRQTPAHTVFSLAGVNTQLRSEFLPLCQNGFTHRVQFEDLPSYIETFVAPHDSVSGTISIGVSAPIKCPVDVTPFMSLLRAYPGLTIEIASPPVGQSHRAASG